MPVRPGDHVLARFPDHAIDPLPRQAEAALEAATRAVDLAPEDPRPPAIASRALTLLGRHEEALAIFRTLATSDISEQGEPVAGGSITVTIGTESFGRPICASATLRRIMSAMPSRPNVLINA